MTRYEIRALQRFRIIYLGSLFTLAFVIATLYYENKYASLLEMEKYKMQHYASELSSFIISTHMQRSNAAGNPAIFNEIPREKGLEFSLYDNLGQGIYGSFDEPVRLERGFYETDDNFYLVEQNTYMHLGVEYVAVKTMGIHEMSALLFREVSWMLLVSLAVISAVGFYLSRLFLIPVRDEINRIDRFIKDTTHELNTPIAAILMSISRLKKMEVDTKVVRRIELSAKRVSDIYNDLTYLFFGDLKKKQPVSIDWKKLVERRVEYYRDFAELKRIGFVLDLKPSSSEMDEESAMRLLDNLISNAIKYNRPGGKIIISLEEGILVVEDTGIGMEESVQEEVFIRYKRANDTEGGFGVGLSIVAAICREYGIDITLESQKGVGTAFTLKL